MVLAVPAISWVKQSALFLLLAAVLLIGLGMTFWSRQGEAHSCFIAITGAVVAFLCMASAVTAEPSDSVERGQRMDTDAIRDDVRTNRLQILLPLVPKPQAQPARLELMARATLERCVRAKAPLKNGVAE
jgi:hypothetical protein